MFGFNFAAILIAFSYDSILKDFFAFSINSLPFLQILLLNLLTFSFIFLKFMYSLRDYQAGLSKITKIIEDCIDVRNNIRRLATFASCAFASRTFASRAFFFRTFASRAFASRAFASRAFACEKKHPTSHGFRVLRFRLSHFRISRFRVSRFRLTRFRVSYFRLTRFRVSPSEEKRHVISTNILPCMYIFPSRAPYCTVQSMLLPNHTCSAMGKANDFALVS